MEILIITVFNSHNFGSFLQANQLAKQLTPYGNVSLFNSHTRNNFRLFLHNAKVTVLHRNTWLDCFRGPWFEFCEWLRIRAAWNNLKSTETYENADLLVLGSDEIWNIKRKECRYPIYWGYPSNSFKFSYAPSINKAEVTDFNERPEYVQYLHEIDCISVRDQQSKRVLETLTDRDVSIVLDPTLLSEPEHYCYQTKKPYIAVYLFEGTLEKSEKEAVIKFAKQKNLEIVSAGQYLSWCDRSVHSINGNPFYIFENAEYVITNTFHGTAYAINYRTQFISFGSRKPKILSMMQQLDMEERVVSDPATIESVLEKKIDYTHLEKGLIELRKASLEYIEQSIMMYGTRKDAKREC